MSKTTDKPIVIVGAGLTGLSLGCFLAQQGVPSVIVEQADRPGGLARSFKYGDFSFDIGPHRFHSEDRAVTGFLLDVLGADALRIRRSSQVRFEGRTYPWPLHPSYVLFRFPTRIAFSILRDLFFMFRKPEARTFKDQIVNMYGRTLYNKFFEGYSSKFLGIVPELTHPDWAKTGIDRAIIDKRLKMHNLWQLLFRALFPTRSPELEFLYPRGSCGQFADALAARYREAGGELLLGQTVESMETVKGRVAAVQVGEHTIRPSKVVWTGTVHALADLLNLDAPRLTYLAMVCYFLMLSEGPKHGFQWSYHGAPDVVFSRVSVPANFSPANTPKGSRSLCVEVTCRQDDSIYSQPERGLDRVVTGLKQEGLLLTDQEIVQVQAKPISWAYPIYRIDYRDALGRLEEGVGRITNLVRAGRLGLFWYNNMDHCIEASAALADRLVAERKQA